MQVSTEYRDFEQFLSFLAPDTLFLPKSVTSRRDISDEAKFMCSIIITKYRFESIEFVKTILENCTDDDIRMELGNVNVSKIKTELKKVAADLETSVRPLEYGKEVM